jgi:hypothetical protein
MHVHWSLLALIGSPLIALSIGAAALLAGAEPVARLMRGPYLQLLTTTGVSIVWRTSAPAWCALTIRPVDGGETRVVSGPTDSDCALDVGGLSPGTRYAYVPLADGAPIDEEAVFRTDDPAAPFTFLVIGDSGTGGAAQYAVRDRMLATPADFILHTGDMVYEDGEAEDFDRKLFRPYGEMLRSLVLWPTLGNHDVDNDDETDDEAWFDAFRTPANNPAGDEGYYSFDFGNAHVAVLDSNSATGETSAQRLFLEQDLAASTATWKFVAFHHTIYSSGAQHGSDISKRNNLLPAIDPYGVDVVFMGHEHIYERTWPMRGDNVVAPEVGTVYVTTGGGGYTLHDIEAPNPFTAYLEKTFHFVRVTIDGPHLVAQMIYADGTVGDEFSITKGDVPPPLICGDGIVNGDETCDGQNRAACAGACAANCTCEPVCGDGSVNFPQEECDGADAAQCPDACLSDCICDQGPSRLVRLDAVADTSIDASADPTWDHGGMDRLVIDGATDPASVAYLKFDLSSISQYVVRATLSLHALGPSFDAGTVYPVPDASWIEGAGDPEVDPVGPGLKWVEVDTNGDEVLNENDADPYAPRFERRAGSLVSVEGMRAEVDVTSAFQDGPRLYAIAIMNDASDGASFASREHIDPTMRPRLVLEIGDPPVTTTITTTTITSTTTTTPTSTTSTTTSTAPGPTSTSTSTTTSTSAVATTSSTLPSGEVCSGGADEDQDGFIDCVDTDCAGHTACPLSCATGPEWTSLACRFTGLAAQVGNRLAPRRLRTVLMDDLGRAASARIQAEANCALGQRRRARAALRKAMRAVAAFRRRLNAPAGRQAIAVSDREAWRPLAAEMRADLEALRATLDCG